MSKTVEIINPIPGGSGYTSARKAAEYVLRGRAIMVGSQLQFVDRKPDAKLRPPPQDALWWNGARSRYINGTDVAMFPPGCNVLFPKVGTARAARRYS